MTVLDLIAMELAFVMRKLLSGTPLIGLPDPDMNEDYICVKMTADVLFLLGLPNFWLASVMVQL